MLSIAKRILFILTLLDIAFPVAPTYAATGFVKATVEFARVHDGTVIGAGWAPPRFWFTLTGVTGAGGCPTWSLNGKVLFVSETREAYLAVLSAYMTGKELAVYWDDTQLLNGICRAGQITIGNPPPLF
jgi:hypothetical protein